MLQTDSPPQLSDRIVQLLANANLVTPEKILTTAPLTFERLGLTGDDVDLVRQHYAATVFTGFTTASAVTAPPRITFGCAALDRLTRNGLPTRGLTELAGIAGAGKSQLCMQLALMVQLPIAMGGLERAAAIVCTEGGGFASGRLYEMIDAVHQLFGRRVREVPFSSRVFVEQVHDVPGLLHCVRVSLPRLCAQHEIGIVCIDSVAAVFRNETDDVRARAHDMRCLALALRRLADQYGCAVVCVNQVTSVIDDDDSDHNSSTRLVPCLGLAWANLVTTRLQLHRSETVVAAHANVRRTMEVVFSPELPPGRAEFVITGDGIADMPETR